MSIAVFERGEALSPTVCDGIQNHTYNAPKWIKLEELAQLFEAVQRKIFPEISVDVLKSDFWPEMAIFMPFYPFNCQIGMR